MILCSFVNLAQCESSTVYQEYNNVRGVLTLWVPLLV